MAGPARICSGPGVQLGIGVVLGTINAYARGISPVELECSGGIDTNLLPKNA